MVNRVFCSLVWFFVCCESARSQVPDRVDWRPYQTPVKSQGSRGSCYIYGVVAAMEAGYKRAGYGDLDLAEHFSDYVARMMFLETCEFNGRFRTPRMRVPAAWERESGIPWFETMSGTVDSLVTSNPVGNLGIPEEVHMPLTDAMFDTEGIVESDPYWQRQYNVSTHLMAEERLPRSALQAPFYYRVKRHHYLPKADATNPQAIEQILAAGREVIWDFRMAGDHFGKIWRYNGPAGDVIAHRMLIVGYDRRDPSEPYFIVKNSWGHPAANSIGDDFTYVAYDYLQYGEWASWIEVELPEAKPEMAFVGRWNVIFGPHRGTLDVYHLPGLMEPLFDHNQYKDKHGHVMRDHRIGTFYQEDDPERPYRVNGVLRDHRLEAWIDFQQPAMRWDQMTGWRLQLTLSVPDEAMTGSAKAPNGPDHEASAHRMLIRSKPLSLVNASTVASDATPQPPPLPAAEADPASAPQEIEAKWLASGGADFLGKPITGVETCPDGRGRYTHYERGSIYWSPTTPASLIYGAIRERWSQLGWETSALGYPTSDEIDWGTGRMNSFENGRILWHPDQGPWEELSEIARQKSDPIRE